MKKYIQLLTLSLLVVVVAMYSACKKGDAESDITAIETPTEGKYKKIMTLKDDSGENWMTLEVSADSEELLAASTTETFTLTALREIEEQDIDSSFPIEEVNESAPSVPKELVYINVLDEYKAEGVSALSITIRKTQGVQSRAFYEPGYYYSASSACGKGWRLRSNSEGGKFDVWHYNHNGDCNTYPNTYHCVRRNQRLFLTGYFWAQRNRIVFRILSPGDYTLSHVQINPHDP